MVTRRLMLRTCGAILGLVLAAGSVKAMTANRLTFVTVSGPFSLPGVTLGAGTYTFELADPSVSHDLVRVRSKDRGHVYFLGFTNRVDRPAGRLVTRPVVFGESPAGGAPPIAIWYPDDDLFGHAFIYPKKAR